MASKKPSFEMSSFGIYDVWDEKSKALPKVKEFTTKIPANLDIEFGFILHAKKAKGAYLEWAIFHPDIPDDKGQVMPPFEGGVYVRNNDWEFYLGDTVWEPIETKVGDWKMQITHNNKVIAEKTFNVAQEHGDGEIQFWKKRGY